MPRFFLIVLLLFAPAGCGALRRPALLRLSGGHAALPEWSVHTTDDGRVYYFDAASGTSTWDPPPEFEAGTEPQQDHASDAAELPEGWSAHAAPDGRTYYYHQPSGQSSWELPMADSTAGDAQEASDQPSADEAHSEEAVESFGPEVDAAEAEATGPAEEAQQTEETGGAQDDAATDYAALLAERARSYADGSAASSAAEPTPMRLQLQSERAQPQPTTQRIPSDPPYTQQPPLLLCPPQPN